MPVAVAASCISCSREDKEAERAAIAILDTPALTKDMAAARPMPLEAPLRKTHLPCRSNLAGSIAGYVSSLRVDVKLKPVVLLSMCSRGFSNESHDMMTVSTHLLRLGLEP